MVTAFVLVNIRDRKTQDIAEELLTQEGVKEAHVVAGEYDMVAVVRVADNSTLSHLITECIAHIDGIERTKTLFALRSFSSYDLSSIFAVL